MAGNVIGEAFVRIRPVAGAGFRNEVAGQVRHSTHGLGKIIGGALGIGVGLGVERELEKTIDAAKEAEVVNKRLQASLHALGISYSDNADQIEEQTQALAKLSSFEDEELFGTFTQLVRRTDDVTEALRLNALAADVARGSGFNLTTVAKAIGRAYDGQITGLSRLGIAVKKGISGTEALRLVQEKYAGSAAAFASTAEGSQERLNKVLNDSREIIGGALLPVITDLAGRFADYIEKENESGDLQRKVNTVMKEGASFAHALSEALGTISRVVTPLVNAVGGLGNALQLAIGLKFATMIRNAIAGFGLLGGSVARTSAAGVGEATAFGRAWDIATRPRNMVVTTTYTGPGGAGGGGGGGGRGTPPVVGVPGGGKLGGKLGRGKSVADRINQYGRRVPKVSPTAGLGGGLLSGLILYGGFTVASAAGQSKGFPAYNIKTDQWFIVYTDPAGNTYPRETSEDFIKKTAHGFWQKVQYRLAAQRAKDFKAPAPPSGPDEGTRGKKPGDKPAKNKKGTGPQGMTRLQGLRLQLAAAERRGDLQAEKRIQAQIVGLYQDRVDNTKLTGQALVRFKQELSDEEDKLDGIQDSIVADQASKRAQAQSDRADKAAKAATKKEAADQKLLNRLARGRTTFTRAVARAAETAGTKDDVATAKALRDRIQHEIDVVRASNLNMATKQAELDRLSDEYASAVLDLGKAKDRRRAALKAAAAAAAAQRTDDLDKILQIAELTDDPAAVNRALDAAIANARKLLNKAIASGKGVLDATLKLEGLKKQRRDLLKQGTSATTQGTTAFDLLSQFGGRFTGGNLINADQPFQGPSGFQDDIAPFLARQPGFKPRSGVTSTTGGSAVSAIEKLIAALDRNTNATKGGNAGTVNRSAAVPTPERDRRADAAKLNNRYYEAMRARENVDSRGGV